MRLAFFQPATDGIAPPAGLVRALLALGWEYRCCRVTGELEAWAPDLVIAADAFVGKRTGHPWIGWLRQEAEAFRTDWRKMECLLSHDGWLVETAGQKRFLEDVLVPTGRPADLVRLDGDGDGADSLAGRIVALADQVRSAGGFMAQLDGPSVDCIVRVGSRDRAFVARCLESLAEQTRPGVGVILVRFGPVPGLEAEVERVRDRLRRIQILDLDGPAPRSTALWRGLSRVEADLFGMLDDDDALHPNHIAALSSLAAGRAIAFSGCVRVWEAPDTPGRPSDPGKEHRDLHALPSPRIDRFLNWWTAIHSSAFLASSALLPHIGPDPGLDFAEDTFLLRRLARVAPLRASWRVSTDFYWREGGGDNTAFRQEGREESLRRIADRERLDPVIAHLKRGMEHPEESASPAWGQPPNGPALKILADPADFWGLPTGCPLYIYGSGFGGRVVWGEIAKCPHLETTGFLDSRHEGEAHGLPVRTPDSLPSDASKHAVVVIASEFVAEMAATLQQRGFSRIYDSTPFIRRYVDLRRG